MIFLPRKYIYICFKSAFTSSICVNFGWTKTSEFQRQKILVVPKILYYDFNGKIYSMKDQQ